MKFNEIKLRWYGLQKIQLREVQIHVCFLVFKLLSPPQNPNPKLRSITTKHELINALKNQNMAYFTVYIDTNDLNQIHDFGLDVFIRNLLGGNRSRNLIFIGRHKHRFTA